MRTHRPPNCSVVSSNASLLFPKIGSLSFFWSAVSCCMCHAVQAALWSWQRKRPFIVADASSLQLFCSLLLLIVITLKYSCKKKKNMYRKYSCKICVVQPYCSIVSSNASLLFSQCGILRIFWSVVVRCCTTVQSCLSVGQAALCCLCVKLTMLHQHVANRPPNCSIANKQCFSFVQPMWHVENFLVCMYVCMLARPYVCMYVYNCTKLSAAVLYVLKNLKT